MPGPPPTPTAILAMRGSWRAKRRTREPISMPGGVPACPAWLDDKARIVWQTLIPQLEELGILAPIDGFALGRYCVLFTRWQSLYALLEVAEAVSQDIRRLERAWRQLGDCLFQLEVQYGMTPSARAKLGLALGRRSE